jgi:hypothetical protein
MEFMKSMEPGIAWIPSEPFGTIANRLRCHAFDKMAAMQGV